MLPVAALKDQLKTQLTPRRRRNGLIFLAIFIVYSGLGLLAAPSLVIHQAQKFVQEKLKLELSIEKLEVNPWLLAVRIDGLRLKEPGMNGETLVAAKSAYVNAQLWSSLWLRGASLAEVDLLDPYINTRIRKDGSINLLQLLPPEDPEDKSEAHWRIRTLGVHRGRIDFHDDTRPTPFAALFSPLNLNLSDLSSRPDKDGGYTLHAETGDGEALDWHGTVAMQPVRSQGELKISKLKATTPWRYLQDELPIIVEKGYISISSHYSLTADEALRFSLEHGRVVVDGLVLNQRGDNPLSLKLKQLDLNGINLEWPAKTASFDMLSLQDFHVADKTSKRDLASFSALQLQRGRYLPSPEKFDLASLGLQQFVLNDTGEQSALITLPALTLQKLGVMLVEQTAHVEQVALEKGDIVVRREKNGSLNWETQLKQLGQRMAQSTMPEKTTLTPAPTAVTKKSAKTVEKPWVATLGELDLLGFRIDIDDQLPQQAVKSSLEDINLRILPRQSGMDAHALEGHLRIATGGSLALKGKFNEHPLSANIDLDLHDLKLPPFAPYFADHARFALESGALDIGGKFHFSQSKNTQADFNGNVAVHNFSANDLDQDERFLAWNKLAINGLSWQLAPGQLRIHDIQAEQPFIRVIIGQDKTLNLSHIVVAAPEEKPAESVAASTPVKTARIETPYPLRIDRIRMKNGSMLFADFTLKPQFATGIQTLNGDISGISSDPASRATVALSGRVDQYGKADISGTINPLASDIYTDISVKFSNLELTTLTPYSAKFAGYRIDKGKLSLNLDYEINQRQLTATNKVVFTQLTLGDAVDSPDAMHLPLKLAVAILKDRNGVIDMDLPLSGSLDDPQFNVGPIIWKAFLNLLTKAATSPFSLMADLVGGGDSFDSLNFATGQSTLAPEETAKLDKLAKALGERPALGVEVRGAFDPQADALAIKTRKFDAVYQKHMVDGDKPRKTLEVLFTEKLGREALAQQRALNLNTATEAAKNKDELELAVNGYLKSLRNELIAREIVLDGDLRQLALERARTVRNQLVEVNKVDAARVFVLEPVTVPATDTRVVMKVALTAT